MKCHASQVNSESYIDLQKTAARLLGLTVGVGYAMGLYANDPVPPRTRFPTSRFLPKLLTMAADRMPSAYRRASACIGGPNDFPGRNSGPASSKVVIDGA